MAVDCRREPAIDRNLPQNSGQFVRRKAVPKGTTEMGFELMHPAEAGDHTEIEDAAIARLERIVPPHRTPAIGGKQFLELAIEIVGVGDGAIDILIAQYLAPHRHSTIIKWLVHVPFPSRWR